MILKNFYLSSLDLNAKQVLSKIIFRLFKSIKETKKLYINQISNPPNKIEKVLKGFWDKIIEYSKSIGVDLIGFAPVKESFMFKTDFTCGINQLYKNGIVLGKEMQYSEIDTAPSSRAFVETIRVYAELGEATNKLASFIISKNVNAIPCHPLGGPILYPAMAVSAGMGSIGKQGILITKNMGPGKDFH